MLCCYPMFGCRENLILQTSLIKCNKSMYRTMYIDMKMATQFCKRSLVSFANDSRKNGHSHTAAGLFKNPSEDLVVLTKRISWYSRRGEVDHARKLFDGMLNPDSVCWNVMIKCYVENRRIRDARELFDNMSERSSYSWNTMIVGYTQERMTDIGLKLFWVMPDKDVFSWTAIITGLFRVSRVEDAWRLFKQMQQPNSITWASVISGFQQNGLAAKTLNMFKEMLFVGIRPTSHSFTSALTASADLAMLSMSLQLYSQLLKCGYESNTHVGNSAISMFIKCGTLYNARHVFVDLPQPDNVSWNSMIIGYGQHGYGREAIMIFHQMQKTLIMPDGISFLGLLHGCSHCGLVEEGKQYFYSMVEHYGISPGLEHYACIVDLLARAGLLKEATEIIFQMPFVPTTVFWRTLLNGCRIWDNMKLGVYAAEQILKLEPDYSSACLMIIDIFASAGRWKESMQMRRLMREQATMKELGCSWVEIEGKIHLFTTRDETHTESGCLYSILELLSNDILEFEMDTSLIYFSYARQNII